MRPYEVMVIFDTGSEPPAIQAVVDRIIEVVRSTDGNPGAINRWGRRAFAYEVNHKREGYYVLIEFTGSPATVAELDRILGLADEVMRHKVERLPDKVGGRAGPGPGGATGGAVGGSGGRSDGAPAVDEPAEAARAAG